MRPRTVARGVLIAAVAVGLAGVAAAGQSSAPNAPTNRAAYTPPRTPDGQPDISGMWLPNGGQPMETPTGEPWKPPPGANRGNGAAFDFGGAAAEAKITGRRSTRDSRTMVVDPADGKIPLQPWAAAKRTEIVAKQDKVEFLDPRVRCLQSGVPRANLPVGYNTYQIIQIPGHVVLLYEWNHMTRMIPLDGRPHVDPKIRIANGDSRGRWEGNTLVVDVTNFNDDAWVVGHGAPPEGAPASSITSGHGVIHSEALHVVERYTLVDPDTIRYEARIEDPKVFTQPWTIAFDAFKRAPKDHQLFEYACHEGNQRNVLLSTGVDITKGDK